MSRVYKPIYIQASGATLETEGSFLTSEDDFMTDQTNGDANQNSSRNKVGEGSPVDNQKEPIKTGSWQQALCNDMQERGEIHDLARHFSHDI